MRWPGLPAAAPPSELKGDPTGPTPVRIRRLQALASGFLEALAWRHDGQGLPEVGGLAGLPLHLCVHPREAVPQPAARLRASSLRAAAACEDESHTTKEQLGSRDGKLLMST